MYHSKDSIKRIYHALDHVSEPQQTKCLNVLSVIIKDERLRSAPGSSHNHQAWLGGYLDHIAEALDVGVNIYASLSQIRELPFTLSDALVAVFCHDLEKPWKRGYGIDIPKSENNAYRVLKLQEFGFELTPEQHNAIKYAEGEKDEYSSKHRVMGPLAAFVHMCDVCSARIWPEEPSHG